METTKIINDYLNQLSILSICNKFNISKSTLYRILNRNNVNIKKRYMDNLTNTKRMHLKRLKNKACLSCGSFDLFLDKKYCYLHWICKIFKGIKDRIQYQKYYKDRTCVFSKKEFIKWAIENKPFYIKKPSIDRIDNLKGYSLDNIRWLECGDNSRRNTQDNVKEGYKRCPTCKKELLATEDNFYRKNNKNSRYGVDGKCKQCRKIYIHQWRYKNGYIKKLKFEEVEK
jgi:hypothetical protein